MSHTMEVIDEILEKATREGIGVEVVSRTVCPCSQGMSAARAKQTLEESGVDEGTITTFLEEVPQPGHSQREHTMLTVESDSNLTGDLHDVIDIARDSMSARFYNLAKRLDEDHMTDETHANAKFVGDCVRTLAEGAVDKFDHLSDDAVITMKQSNDESIHQHNASAERVAELGGLREEITA